MISTPHVSEEIPAFALDCLDAEETVLVEAHLTVCAACRKELEGYKATASQLGLATQQTQPPPRLKASILRRVGDSQTRSVKAIQKPDLANFWVRLYQALAASLRSNGPIWVAVSLLLIITLAAGNIVLWNQVQKNRTSTEFHLVAMKGTDGAPNASGIMVISQEGMAGTLIVDGLPLLDSSKQYQLWLIKGSQRVSGGLFHVGEGGYGRLAVQAPGSLLDYSSFGITIEPTDGSPGPTGTKVLGGNL